MWNFLSDEATPFMVAAVRAYQQGVLAAANERADPGSREDVGRDLLHLVFGTPHRGQEFPSVLAAILADPGSELAQADLMQQADEAFESDPAMTSAAAARISEFYRRQADAGNLQALVDLGDFQYWDEPQAARAAYRDAEGTQFPVRLRDEHPSHRPGLPQWPLDGGHQALLIRRRQDDPPVDARGGTASIALRHLPHADQRVRPAPEHQLLQAADPLVVPGLRCREDPLPQPPYLLLPRPPVGLIPLNRHVTGAVLRSVRCPGLALHLSHGGSDPFAALPYRGGKAIARHRVQLALRFRRLAAFSSQTHLAHVSTLSGPGNCPYPASYPGRLVKGTSHRAPVSCCLSATGIGFLGHPDPPRNSASLTVGLPATGWTTTGFPRSARMRPDRGGCLLYPGAVVPTWPERNVPASTRRFPAASPEPLPPSAIRQGPQSRGISEGSRNSPVRSSSRPYSPG